MGSIALTDLDLGFNELRTLSSDIFDGLTALTTLDLSLNALSTLPNDIFDGLTDLTTLYLDDTQLTELSAGIFDGLTDLTTLYLEFNELSSLPPGIFSGLTALTTLALNDNSLSSLPPGVFSGLTALTTLYIENNTVDPILITVSLEKITEGTFKATIPTGALYDIQFQLTFTNGALNSGESNITIPQGSVESEDLTVTRSAGTTAAVTVDISTPLPSIPDTHDGYTLVKSEDLPLEVISSVPGAPVLAAAGILSAEILKSQDPVALEAELDILHAKSDGSLKYLQAIVLLESLLASLHPEETRLLANYPNPFNPETWIPYHLANPSYVRVTIYDARVCCRPPTGYRGPTGWLLYES